MVYLDVSLPFLANLPPSRPSHLAGNLVPVQKYIDTYISKCDIVIRVYVRDRSSGGIAW